MQPYANAQGPPEPPSPTPPPTYQPPPQSAPPPQYYGQGAPPPATWNPPAQRATSRPVAMPRWLDYGMIIIGIGTLLMFIGFLFGDGAASQLGTGGSQTTYQGDLEAFFVLCGIGVLLIVGGWLYRVAMAARKAMA